MVIYFSGTGNSRYVAESLGHLLGESTYFMPQVPASSLSLSGENVIFVFPVYSWGVPPLVLDYIGNLSDAFVNEVRERNIPVSMVCTCGDEVAETPEMFCGAWSKRGVEVKGLWSVIMPNNYVLLPGFSVDRPEVEREKLECAPGRVREIAMAIQNRDWKRDVVRGSWPRLKTRLIYPLFVKWGINPRKWKVSEECVRCGRCVKACPVGNMAMKAGTPSWDNHCVSCTACYHSCPAKAISYSSFTNSKGQYTCHLSPIKPEKRI